MSTFAFHDGDETLLVEVSPLWEKLRAHHQKKTRYFAEPHATMTFAKRRAELCRKDRLQVELVRDTNTSQAVGYCVSSLSRGGEGEIESLFVAGGYRGQGLGDEIMRRSLVWLEAMRAARIA